MGRDGGTSRSMKKSGQPHPTEFKILLKSTYNTLRWRIPSHHVNFLVLDVTQFNKYTRIISSLMHAWIRVTIDNIELLSDATNHRDLLKTLLISLWHHNQQYIYCDFITSFNIQHQIHGNPLDLSPYYFLAGKYLSIRLFQGHKHLSIANLLLLLIS